MSDSTPEEKKKSGKINWDFVSFNRYIVSNMSEVIITSPTFTLHWSIMSRSMHKETSANWLLSKSKVTQVNYKLAIVGNAVEYMPRAGALNALPNFVLTAVFPGGSWNSCYGVLKSQSDRQPGAGCVACWQLTAVRPLTLTRRRWFHQKIMLAKATKVGITILRCNMKNWQLKVE